MTTKVAPTLLTYGFRPFFLGATVWAATALTVWIVMLATGDTLPSRFDPLEWHIHEMLFGFVAAAIAGFSLTAIPSWTGRPPVIGGRLACLAALWMVGRIVCLVSVFVPAWLALAIDASFTMALAGVAGYEIISGRNWRNLPIVALLSVLAAANVLMHLQAYGAAVPDGLGWRLGFAAVIVLISVVAGRIVPNFTRNWLAKRPGAALPAAPGRVDRAALAVLPVGLFCWAFLPESRAIGWLLLLGAALNLWRLSRWRTVATIAEPLLMILHIGYAWLVLGVALLGLANLNPNIPPSAAIHALTVGGVSTMILAVMSRATRGHTGRQLKADRATSLIYLLVNLAAITRVAAAFGGAWTMILLVCAACFWIAAFAGFVIAYGPMLILPRRANLS